MNPEEIQQAIARGTARAMSAGKRKFMRSSLADRLFGARSEQEESSDEQAAHVLIEPMPQSGIADKVEQEDGRRPEPGAGGSVGDESNDGSDDKQEAPQELKHVDAQPREEASKVVAGQGDLANRKEVSSSPAASSGLVPPERSRQEDSSGKSSVNTLRDDAHTESSVPPAEGSTDSWLQHNTLYYTAEQAASKLGCSAQDVETKIRSGALQTVSNGSKRLIPARDVDALLTAEVMDPTSTAKARTSSPVGNLEKHQESRVRKDREAPSDELTLSPGEGYYYTPRQAADILDKSLFEVDALIRRAVLPAESIDKHRWIPAKPLEDFVRRERGAGRLAKVPKPQKVQRRGGEGQEKGPPKEDDGNKGHKTKGNPAKGAGTLEREKTTASRARSYPKGDRTISRASLTYYTVEEAADKLGASVEDVRYMIFLGRLKEEVIDGKRVLSKRAVEMLLLEAGGDSPPQDTSSVGTVEYQGESLKGAAEVGTEEGRNVDRGSRLAPKPAEVKDYYTPSQAAEILGKSSAGIFGMIDKGKLPTVRLDAQRYKWVPANVVIPAAAVENLLPGNVSKRRETVRRTGLRPYRLKEPGESLAVENESPSPEWERTQRSRSGGTLPDRFSDGPTRKQGHAPAAAARIPTTGQPDAADTSVSVPPVKGQGASAPQTQVDEATARPPRAVSPEGEPVVRSGEQPELALGLQGLSNRTKNCLIRAGILTVSDLQQRGRDELLAIPNFGIKCLKEVEELLTKWPNSPSYGHDKRHTGTADRLLVSRSDNRASSAGTWTTDECSSLDLPIRESFAYHLLSRRTQKRLAVAGIESLYDLRKKTPEDLLAIWSFGAKCLSEVEVFLEAHGLRLGETEPEYAEDTLVPPQDVERPKDFEGLLSLLSNSVPLRRRLEGYANSRVGLTLDAIARCQSKVEEQVSKGALDDHALLEWPPLQYLAHLIIPPTRTLSDLLFRLQYLACGDKVRWLDAIVLVDKALNVPTLDGEIAQLLGGFDERTLEVLRQRLCTEPKTLREIGEGLGVSHERVRQLEVEAIKRLKRDYVELPLPRMRTAMSQVRNYPAASPEEVREVLRTSELIQDPASVDILLLAWRAIRPNPHPFPQELDTFIRTGLTSVQLEISNEVTAIARRLLRMGGAAALDEIMTELEYPCRSEKDVAAVLTKAGLQELVPGYWGTPNKSYVVHRVAEKMIKTCGPLSPEHVHIGLLRHQQRHGYGVPRPDVLSAVLHNHEGFYVDDRGLVHLHDLARGASPNPAEYAWLEAVSSHGPVVHASTMYRALDKNGVNNGLMTYLTKHSELVQPLGEGLYCLPGTRFTDKDIETGRGQASEQWIKRFMGYHHTGASDEGNDALGLEETGRTSQRLLSARDFGRTLRPPRSKEAIIRLCQRGRIEQATKNARGDWVIPEGATIKGLGVRTGFARYEGVSPSHYARIHGVAREQVYHLLRQNRIEGARKTEHGWDIPPDAPYPADGL